MNQILIILGVFLWINAVHSFNTSPIPNIELKWNPSRKSFQNKTRSSYFGYSIILRKRTIIIGAPRDQSSFIEQRNINETGSIYQCSLYTALCTVSNFNSDGNIKTNDFKNKKEDKKYQMLGANMDGEDTDDGGLIVCAPNYVGDINYYSEFIAMNGMCYTTHKYVNNQPNFPFPVDTLYKQDDNKYLLYTVSQQGFSSHYNNETYSYITGAPGVNNWTGSVVVWDRLTALYQITDSENLFQADSYFGWSVSSLFLKDLRDTLLWVASAPRANNTFGIVVLFEIVPNPRSPWQILKNVKVDTVLEGEQMGAFFGYDILAEDFNSDGFTDLAVSSPMYSKDKYNENGAVFLYPNIVGFSFLF